MITRGTTPTIQYKFKNIDVTDLVVADMRIKQKCVVIDKALSDATVVHEEGANYLEWTLTQAETLSLNPFDNLEIQCRWKLISGIAGASPISAMPAYRILKDGEI